MGTRSGILLPEPYWLVEGPNAGTLGVSPETFFEEIASWRLSSGLSVSALRGAILSFDFKECPEANIVDDDSFPSGHFDALVAATQVRVRMINGFSYCLHVARITEENHGMVGFRVNHADLLQFADNGFGVSGPAVSRLPMLPGIGFSVAFGRGEIIPETTIDAAASLLDSIMLHDFGKALELITLANDALVSYKAHDFSAALVTAWTICEALLEHYWRTYIGDSSTQPVSRKRLDKLTGRDFTASVISEILELAQVIDPELLELLDRIRKGRNGWMHSIKSPDREMVADSLVLVTRMLEQTLGNDLPLNLSIGATGF